jgi:Xaa-Pro aminopeptidase
MTAVAPAGTQNDAERERRAALLQELLEANGLDALVLAANDYRGHKGTLRWVADYNLAHRYGYAVVLRGREPELVLPENLAMGRPGAWRVPTRYARRVADGLVEALGPALLGAAPQRIGVVGLNQVMKVEDYLAIREAFPHAELVDAGDAFERLRAPKTEAELEGVRESTRIAEACFERLLEVARPGVTEREVGGEMFGRAASLGGEDFLFLTMYAEPHGDEARGTFGVPGSRVLEPGSLFIFSFELIGPLGYWMEFSRMVAVGEPTELQQQLNAAVAAGMHAGAAAMRPGALPHDVQRSVLDAVEAHGGRSTYWSGHGLGQDVIEEPWLGLEVVQDRDAPGHWELAERMVLALHPYVTDEARQGIGYMANSYVVGPDGGAPFSQVPLDLYVVR